MRTPKDSKPARALSVFLRRGALPIRDDGRTEGHLRHLGNLVRDLRRYCCDRWRLEDQNGDEPDYLEGGGGHRFYPGREEMCAPAHRKTTFPVPKPERKNMSTRNPGPAFEIQETASRRHLDPTQPTILSSRGWSHPFRRRDHCQLRFYAGGGSRSED